MSSRPPVHPRPRTARGSRGPPGPRLVGVAPQWAAEAGGVMELIDTCRRALGDALDTCYGLAPVETTSRAALVRRGFTLKAYQPPGRGAAMLLVPAPIKRPYIWDLAPPVSVVRHCLRAGLRVYMVDWSRPSADSAEWGLAHYGGRFLLDCVDHIEREAQRSPIFLAGHSLGGTLAAIFAALHPRRVAGMVLLESPLRFGPGGGALARLVASAPPAGVLTGRLPRVPGTVLDLAAFCAAPDTFVSARAADFWASLASPEALLRHLRVERWTLDEAPLARSLFEDVVESLYRRDEFARHRLVLDGRRADPAGLNVPALVVLSRHSAVVPPESVLPVCRQFRRRPTLLWYEGDIGVSLQHLGALVGRTAHQSIWPRILRWVSERTAEQRRTHGGGRRRGKRRD